MKNKGYMKVGTRETERAGGGDGPMWSEGAEEPRVGIPINFNFFEKKHQ